MKTRMENIAAANGWDFDYGRADFQNLVDETVAGRVHLFLDPVRRRNIKSTTNGTVTGRRWAGHFMLLLKSDLDEVYDEKYDNYIAQLWAALDAFETQLDNCGADEVELDATEIVNVFSENMDGLTVRYIITETI